jgi:hypothetical protein
VSSPALVTLNIEYIIEGRLCAVCAYGKILNKNI